MKNYLPLFSAIHRLSVTAILAFTILCQPLFAGTLILNSGYQYGPSGGVYPPGANDDYWINVWDNDPGTVPATLPSKVLGSPTFWLPPFSPASTWIAGRPILWNLSPATRYLYRKCFCLQGGFKNLNLTFSIRSDDSVSAFLNSSSNPILATSPYNASLPYPPYSVSIGQNLPAAQGGFREGINCLYVLVRNEGGGPTGFVLEGQVTASYGLFETPAKGVIPSFEPCTCPGSAEFCDLTTINNIAAQAEKEPLKEVPVVRPSPEK